MRCLETFSGLFLVMYQIFELDFLCNVNSIQGTAIMQFGAFLHHDHDVFSCVFFKSLNKFTLKAAIK